ncbi:hypothetical protein AMELA_G00017490 [Ameiurus melas]|uniref:Ig-like domain-containing protein n=1 Tax=Ameiurus melas TaxID=219545 RepID=A0A7J6BAR3_AMEME|nr:hypothetical protein AMELA_G00017490 [Ameiurus melas]
MLRFFLCRALAQKVKVEPEVVAYPGQTVILPCQFPDKGQTQLTQITDIALTDVGNYICAYATYPTGNEKGVTSLILLVGRNRALLWSLSSAVYISPSPGLFLFHDGVLAQKVKVEPEVVAYPGQTVILHCQFLDKGQTQLTQVSWILENSSGTRTVIAVFHPTFGVIYPASPVQGRVSFTLETPSLENPTIQITDIALTDVGNYICEYATYPTGNEKGVTSLILLD